MYQVQAGQSATVKVILTNDTDFKTPVTTKVAADVTVTYWTPGTSGAGNTAANGSWAECALGVYQLIFTAGEVGSSLGCFNFVVACGGALNYYGQFIIVADGPISQSLVQAALTALGFTSLRAALLDFLDVLLSTRATQVSVDALPTAADNADAVWDEALAGHLGVGSTGAALNTAASGAVDVNAIADAVWDEANADHVAAGSTGANLTAASAGGGSDQEEACCVVALRGSAALFRVFLQINGQSDATGTEARITVYEEDGTEAIAVQTDSSPDAEGTFNISVDPHGLSQSTNYLAKVEIDIPAGTITSWQGFSTA